MDNNAIISIIAQGDEDVVIDDKGLLDLLNVRQRRSWSDPRTG